MASDQVEFMEQEPSNDEQHHIKSDIEDSDYIEESDEDKEGVAFNMPEKVEESDQESEDSSEDDEDDDEIVPEHFLSVEQNSSPTKSDPDESVGGLHDALADDDGEGFIMPKHFLSQTLVYSDSDDDDGKEVNKAVGGTAESLMTLSHTHKSGRKRVQYSCNVCEKEFSDKRVCIRHVRTHTGEKPFTCYLCGKSFGREDYLRRHIESHSGEKPFGCPLCNKAFAKKATLAQHLLTHTDMSERPFPCNQCESAFIKKSHLERHLKTHTGIREFVCSTCGKDFMEKRRLLDHERRLHSDRVLPSCKICKREFRWDHLLRKHIKAQTCNPTFEPCDMPKFVTKDETKIKPPKEKKVKAKKQYTPIELPIFVNKGRKEAQANPQNPSINEPKSVKKPTRVIREEPQHPSMELTQFVKRDKNEIKTKSYSPSIELPIFVNKNKKVSQSNPQNPSPIFVNKDKKVIQANPQNSSIELPIFVNKDTKVIQANPRHPSVQTSESQSLYNNVHGVNPGSGMTWQPSASHSHNNQTIGPVNHHIPSAKKPSAPMVRLPIPDNGTVSQYLDDRARTLSHPIDDRARIIAHSTNEQLSTWNPQYYNSPVNNIYANQYSRNNI